LKSSRLQVFVEYLLDNLFDVATIVVAGYLVIRYQIKPLVSPSIDDIANLATWILAVLGLIAVSGLWDRNRRLNRIEKVSEESRDLIQNRISGKVRVSDFFLSERQISDQTFAQANTIYIAGVTLTRTTREYMYILGQRLAAGAYVRIIIADPTKESALHEFALRSMGDTTAEYWRTRLQTVETVIDAIAKTPESKGKLEIGYLPYMPSFGLVITDPNTSHGFCYVELYHHKSAEPNPAFLIRTTEDPHWYQFFLRQYEILWNSCRIEKLPKNAAQTKTN